jgi:hypothetical protein
MYWQIDDALFLGDALFMPEDGRAQRVRPDILYSTMRVLVLFFSYPADRANRESHPSSSASWADCHSPR